MVDEPPIPLDEKGEFLNTIAQQKSFEDLDKSVDDFEMIEKLSSQLAEGLIKEGDVTQLVEETFLSEREAEVYALKMRGLTHDAITLFYRVLAHAGFDGYRFVDGPQSRSTVDEYSRRAGRKYRRADNTVKLLESHYG